MAPWESEKDLPWCPTAADRHSNIGTNVWMRNNHLTDSRWPSEYEQKIWTWPKSSPRRTLPIELDRKYNKYYQNDEHEHVYMTENNLTSWILQKNNLQENKVYIVTKLCPHIIQPYTISNEHENGSILQQCFEYVFFNDKACRNFHVL